MKLRLGTRGSALARWQADFVKAELGRLAPDVEIEIVLIATQGDKTQTGSIEAMGAQGVFTKEIQRALLDNEIDFAVHSLKDLPTDVIEGVSLAASPKRGPLRDAIISPVCQTLDTLPQGARIGTGSLRRRAQLLNLRPDLNVQDIRGNVDTRLRKLDEGQYDAILLAEAGLVRLGWDARITELLEPTRFLPAVGQGALGIEARDGDKTTRHVLDLLNDPATWAAIIAERAMLTTLRGGCLAPIGAWGRIGENGSLRLTGKVLDPEGRQALLVDQSGLCESPVELGVTVAQSLLEQGADVLIQGSRDEQDHE